jgi:hypothetical protein
VFDSEINIIGLNLSKKREDMCSIFNLICPDDFVIYKFYKNNQLGTYPNVDISQEPHVYYSSAL